MMKLYLISNNLLLDSISYNSNNLDLIRMTRPLSIEGDVLAKEVSLKKELQEVDKVYSSFYSSALSTAKYLANNLDLNINMREELNECLVGSLGSKNMKMVKGLQDHEFSYKLPGGESLIDVGNRLDNFINKLNEDENAILFTHKRAIVGYLIKKCIVGYNLDENLILRFNNEVVYDDSETAIDIYEIDIDNRNVKSIKYYGR